MSTITETPKGKIAMAHNQVLTVNGKAVELTPAQIKRATKNSDLLKTRLKTGRGASEHTYGDLIDAIKADYLALKEQGLAALERKFNMGRNLLALRAILGSDKAFGKAVQSYGLDIISRQDRNDLMWLATNERIVHETLKASDVDLSSLGMSALRKRATAHAASTKQETKSVTDRNTTKGRKAKAQAKTSKKSEATVGSSDTKAKAKPYDLDEAMSDMIEQALANGKTLEQVMASFTKQWTEIKVAASLEA